MSVSRSWLFIAMAPSFLLAAVWNVGGMIGADTVGALFWPWLRFWVALTVFTTIAAVLYALAALYNRVPVEEIGMKDERDRRVEGRATLYGFIILYGLSFPAMVLAFTHSPMLGLKIFAFSAIAATGAVIAVGAIDGARMLALSRSAG